MKQDGSEAKDLLERVYRNYGDELYRYALLILADHQAAEHALHQAFCKTLKLGRRAPRIDNLNSYLRTAVRHACYDRIKRKKQDDQIRNPSARPLLQPVNEAPLDDEERKILEQAICRLPPDQREVLYMKIYEGKTFKEIGRLIDISAHTAASRYRYALEKLKTTLPRSE